tara:strand:- start:302 stop:556 length:255 start_codon:yes stop_codon:yes gene_type:complete
MKITIPTMFIDMDRINEDKIMMNQMNYNTENDAEYDAQYDDEEIVLQPNQINYSENNNIGLNMVEKLLLIALMLFGRHYLNINF